MAKRNMNLVREMLLYLEENHPAGSTIIYGCTEFSEMLGENSEFEGVDAGFVEYHVRMMAEQGLLQDIEWAMGRKFITSGISFGGHEFLESTRDPAIWGQVQAAGKKAGGLTFDMVLTTGKGLLLAAAKKAAGL